MSAPASRLSCASLAAALLLGTAGCATFGGNVKGDFSCSAPDGICAPTSSIDDRALAMISGETVQTTPTPARPVARDRRGPALERVAAPSAVRTGERVLRIVFPAHVDAAGQLHETAAVRTVVATGHWQPADMLTVAALPVGDSLADAVDRADPPGPVFGTVSGPVLGTVDSGLSEPGLPDPAAVTAARARLDPVAAIKTDVDQVLKAPKVRTPSPPAALPRSAASAPNKIVGSAASGVSAAPGGPVVRAKSFPATIGEEK